MSKRGPLAVGLGWRLLQWSGLGWIPGGMVLIAQWRPTPGGGPYAIGGNYPFGGYTEAWIVSMGFVWIGVAFVTADPSFRTLEGWIYALPPSAIWAAAMTVGFVLTGREVWRRE